MPILTSTVIECHRVGFQKAAFSYASILMRSEYRSQIDQKYAKKIEAIVRKAPNGIKDAEDSYQDETQPCPVCDINLQIMELSCNQCKTTLPMCISTVRLTFSVIFLCFSFYSSFIQIGSTHSKRKLGCLSCLRFSVF